MSTMFGADADELDRLAGQLSGAAARLEKSQIRIGRSVHNAPWFGRSAEEFLRGWDGNHSRELAQAVRFLREACDELHRHAREQRDASAGATGIIGGSGLGTICTLPGDGDSILEILLRMLGGLGAFPWQELLDEIGPLILDIIDNLDILGDVFGGGLAIFNSVLGVIDLFFDHPYVGNFDWIESAGDVAAIVAGIAGLVVVIAGGAAAAPIVAGVAAIAGGVAIGIDFALKQWDDWGRDAWRDYGAPAWDSATDWVGDRFDDVSDGVGQVWDVAENAVDASVDFVEDAGGAVANGWKAVTGWL